MGRRMIVITSSPLEGNVSMQADGELANHALDATLSSNIEPEPEAPTPTTTHLDSSPLPLVSTGTSDGSVMTAEEEVGYDIGSGNDFRLATGSASKPRKRTRGFKTVKLLVIAYTVITIDFVLGASFSAFSTPLL
ncbi:unnamed protein product [Rhizoctonia solani]|uniref:Uncharacterized protein n=1 Tax=Rhizoctonia solani TaxID=456999 RepID=A0A8H3GHU0_9AGAM|nr:unnamed protein product [Rhizoctonia solani]